MNAQNRGSGLIRGVSCCMAIFVICCGSSVGWANPPVDPLEVPLFSLDSLSPFVDGGTVHASDVLVRNAPATVAFPGPDLGLDDPNDAVDALSFTRTFDPGDQFVVLFSVDRETVGVASPHPDLVAADVPYNAKDQATRGHQAGDQYHSTALFSMPIRRGGRAVVLSRNGQDNNTLVLNNFDEGGTSFGMMPEGTAASYTQGQQQDEVDATATQSTGTRGARNGIGLYFSVTAGSPSLDVLSAPEVPSGANLFFNPDPGDPGTDSVLYASCFVLNLAQNDEIDGLVVLDVDGDEVFEPSDKIIFSLAPGSPSLLSIPDASTTGAAADVFMVEHGSPPTLLVPARALGLGTVDDNIDALELLACNDAMTCAESHGIRTSQAGIPTVDEWGLVLMLALFVVAGVVVVARQRLAKVD